jgi:O-antigen/teichoic acid export membrane protein
MMQMLRGSVVQVVTPHFASWEKEKRFAEILGLWHASIRRLSLVYIPTAIYLIGFAPELITLAYTHQYKAAVPIFRVFTILLIFESFGGIEAILKAFARTHFLFMVDGMRLFLGAVAGYIGLQWVGLIGPAGAVVIMAIVAMMLRLAKIKQIFCIPPSKLLPWKHVLRTLIISATAFLIASGAFHLIDVFALGKLLISSAVFAVSYACIIWFSGLIPESDRKAIMRFLRLSPR